MPTGGQTRAALATVGGGMMSISGGANIGSIVGHVIADISGFTSGLSKATKHLNGFSTKLDSTLKKNATAMRRMGMAATAMGTAIVAAVGLQVRSYGEFERRMRRATAVSEVTDKQFAEMSKMAEKASVDFNFAATQTADAFYYLGSAGLTATEQLSAFPVIAQLSKAAVLDMDNTAEMMVDTIKAYRMEFTEASEVADIFTEAVTSSNMTFSHLGQSMEHVGTIGKRTNNTVAEMVALIGLMANAGIKGTRAGTSLRRALINLAAPSSLIRKEMAKWGISAYDAEQKAKPFIQIVGEFGDALKDATEEQKNMAFATIFGVRAITGQLAIFDIGSEKVKEYVEQIKNSGGASEKVAKKQMKAFLERLGQIGREFQILGRHVGVTLVPALTDLGSKVSELVKFLIKWVDTHKSATIAITATTAAIGVMSLATGGLLLTLSSLAFTAIALGVSIGGLVTVIAATTVGISALVGSIVYITTRMKSMRDEVKRLKAELEMETKVREFKEFFEEIRKGAEPGGPVDLLTYQLESWTAGLEEVEENMRRVMSADRKGLLDMFEEFDLPVPKALLNLPKATSVLRETLLDYAQYSREIIIGSAEDTRKEINKILGKGVADVETAEDKKLTIVQIANEQIKRERTEDYEAWQQEIGTMANNWTEVQYRVIQATKDGIEGMRDAWTGFFSDLMMDGKNWADHMINFARSVQRAMVGVLATRVAEGLMANTVVSGVTNALFGAVAGAGASVNTGSEMISNPNFIGPPSPATLHYGGSVMKTGLAVVHRGETFSGTQGGGGGGVKIIVNNMGSPLMQSQQQSSFDKNAIIVTLETAMSDRISRGEGSLATTLER